MNPLLRSLVRSRFGFSLVELLMMLAVAVMILLFMQSIFSSGVQQTIRGTSLISTIKEANDLVAAIRKDTLNADQVFTLDDTNRPQSLILNDEGEGLPPSSGYSYPSALLLSHPNNATVTYLLYPMPDGKKAVIRTYKQNGQTDRRMFAIPKIRVFRTLMVLQTHQVNQCPVLTQHLFVEIELQNDDPKASKKAVRFTAFLSPSNITFSSWNHLF